MSGFIESEAVFKQRCQELGMSDELFEALRLKDFKTMGRFAYSCNYMPGAADDTGFLAMVQKVKALATEGETAILRRLFFESFTLVQADLKLKIERSDDAPARKLAVPERAARYKAQQARLSGLSLRGELECADSLIDKAVQMFDENRLKYIAWSECLRKRDEMEGIKKLDLITMMPDGTLKASSTESLPAADTSSEYLLRNALTRRGLAMDQAGILKFEIHETWSEKLFIARMKPAIVGYARVSFNQLEAADKSVFERMAEMTREGIVPDPTGKRPLDDALRVVIAEPEVLQMLAQLQSSSDRKREADWSPDASDYKKGKGKGKWTKTVSEPGSPGKSGKKGKGRGKGPTLPDGLKGSSRTKDNSHICFGYNLLTCPEQAKSGCSKGKHVCTACFGNHPYKGNH